MFGTDHDMRHALLAEDMKRILAHTSDMWEELRGQAVLITGGTGFVGTWFLHAFLYANRHLHLQAQAYVVTRSISKALLMLPTLIVQAIETKEIVLIEDNVATLSSLPRSCVWCIHAATDVVQSPNIEDKLRVLDTCLAGTCQTITTAIKHGVERILVVSSGAVYGEQTSISDTTSPDELFQEDQALGITPATATSYAVGKVVSEHIALTLAKEYGKHVAIARLFAFAGPYLALDKQYAVGNFVKNILDNEPIHIRGNHRTLRSYMYPSDMIEWMLTILVKGKSGHAYNVGSEEKITIGALAQNIAEIAQKAHLAPQFDNDTHAHSPVNVYVPNTQKSLLIGLSCRVDIRHALDRMLSFYSASL